MGSKLGSSDLSIPSPPVTSPEPTTHMAGSVSGFSCSPASLPATSCCMSTCAMLRMSSSSKQSAFLVSTSSTPHFMKWEPRNHFCKGWRKTSSRNESRSTTWICGPAFESWDHRALQVHLGACGTRRGCIFSLQRLHPFLPPRFSTREPSC